MAGVKLSNSHDNTAVGADDDVFDDKYKTMKLFHNYMVYMVHEMPRNVFTARKCYNLVTLISKFTQMQPKLSQKVFNKTEHIV